MKTRLTLLVLTGVLAGLPMPAQTYVTPMLGGGQTAANMAHIDLAYDTEANQFLASVDDSEGTPELRALPSGNLFDPQASYAVLNGQAYNAQYGWNPGCSWCFPAGVGAWIGIWIELIQASPGLAFYEEFGPFGGGSYVPIFGTDGSPLTWRWSGRMIHNVVAVRQPTSARYAADYRVYLGDLVTGERFTEYGETTVHLEWTTVPVEEPVEDPVTFKFGAVAPTNGAPLSFINAHDFVRSTEFVVNLVATNGGTTEVRYERNLPLVAVAATAGNGGPVPNYAGLGACLELELNSLEGPHGAQLSFWEAGAISPALSINSGETAGTNRFRLSESTGAPGCDPFGRIAGRRLSVNQPGLYCLSFRVIDTSTNGIAHGPVHLPSEVYRVYFQAGLTIASLRREGTVSEATFGGQSGTSYYLERAPALSPSPAWETIDGPLSGTNRLQRLTDPSALNPRYFYRVRGH